MGSKRVKDVVVEGSENVNVADPEGFSQISRTAARTLAKVPFLVDLRRYGTPNLMDKLWPMRTSLRRIGE